MTNPLELKKSKWTIENWLAAVSEGNKPSGKSVEVTRVEDGAVVEVWYSGGQHFGSGGYSAGAVFAGNPPEYVESGNYESNSFTSDSSAMFRLTAPCVVYEYSGDGINGGRTFRNHAIVCVTEAQIEEAKQVIRQLHQAEIEKADPSMPNLKAVLKADWQYAEDHRRRYHSKGCCWKGVSDAPCGPYKAYRIRDMLENPGGNPSYHFTLSDDGFMRQYLSEEAIQELRLAMSFETSEERLKVFSDAEAEYEADKKAAGKEFARGQINKLVELGFSRKRAVMVMRASGPGLMLDAVEWAKYALSEVNSVDALDCLLSGAGGTNGFGKYRMEEALKAFGLEPPSVSSSGALFSILAGAKQVLLSGVIQVEEDVENSDS